MSLNQLIFTKHECTLIKHESEGKMMRSMDLFGEMDEQVSSMAMDVDDVDPLEIFAEGVIAADNKLADADFFNNFQDDFDDSDIN
ncbi:hypothetical protein JHK87_055888 [Glycine soja]|nr:hypothetical protein JHK87_055888 [Glycine soja]